MPRYRSSPRALLTEHPVTPKMSRAFAITETLVELIRSVGATVEWRQRNTLSVHAKTIRAADLDPVLCARIRASILLAGPLLARCGEVMLPPPGGDVIGRRRWIRIFWLSNSSAPRWSPRPAGIPLPPPQGRRRFLDEPA